MGKEMGDNVQLIGIVGDINGENDTQHIELAQTIAQKPMLNLPT